MHCVIMMQVTRLYNKITYYQVAIHQRAQSKMDVLQFWLRALQAIVAESWGYKLFVCTNP